MLIRDEIHLSKRVAEDEGSISAEPSAVRVPLLLPFSICCLRDENVTLRDKVKRCKVIAVSEGPVWVTLFRFMED